MRCTLYLNTKVAVNNVETDEESVDQVSFVGPKIIEQLI